MALSTKEGVYVESEGVFVLPSLWETFHFNPVIGASKFDVQTKAIAGRQIKTP